MLVHASPEKSGNSSFINRKKQQPFFAPVLIQPKLTIGPVDDPYEQEADAMADKVMRMRDNETLQTKPSLINIQKKCEHCEEEEKLQRKEGNEDKQILQRKTIADFPIQRKCAGCEKEENIQRKKSTGSSVPDVTPSVNQVLQSSGNSLEMGTRSFMESRFGYDFSNVQIHNDSLAHQSSSDINALAYTHGQHIVFGTGQYQPNTNSGKLLLAHELTHVVQQNSNFLHRSLIQRRITVSSAGGAVDGDCGKVERQFTFRLDNPASTDGYFIQQVDRYDNEVDCPGIGVCPANPTTTFWEAFFVKSGSTAFYRQGIGFTDSSGHDSRPNKSGARYAFGEIRFFPIAVTGDLGRNKVAGLWKPGNAGGALPSHNLPSVDKEPSWWGNYTEGPAKRFVTVDWRCCRDGNDYNVIKSSV